MLLISLLNMNCLLIVHF